MLALNYSGWDTELSLELRSSGPIQIPRFAQGRLTAGARLHMGIAPRMKPRRRRLVIYS